MMVLIVFYWGLYVWVIYVVVGFGMVYMIYWWGCFLLVCWLLELVVGWGCVEGVLGYVVDVIVIVGIFFGVVMLLGFGII